tara:strand:- start:562 stop:867 length:306 start_codon:yes stop_codon:yes gene_type:complete
MKLLIIAFFITNTSTYAFDVMLNESNPTMDIQTLVDSGATVVNCEKPDSTPYPRCILNLGSAEVGIQSEGQEFKEVSYISHRNVDVAISWIKKLKTEGICN